MNERTQFCVDCNNVPPSTVKKFVLHGYPAPNMPRIHYFKTLWTLDNETLNVWSHLITALYFVWMLHTYSLEINIVSNWPVLIIILSCLTVTLCSAIAHLFHSRSEFDHCCWMLVDFFGIIMFSFGSTVVHFCASSELSFYSKAGYWNLFMLAFNCCFAYTVLCVTKLPMKTYSMAGSIIRVLVLGYGYIYGILPIFHRFYIGGCSDYAGQCHGVSIFFMALAPCFYITDKPQSYSPGTFDFVGHNHQIFHICISITLYFDIVAVYSDVISPTGHWKALKNQPDHPTLLDIFWFGIFVVVWCSILTFYTVYNAYKHHEKNK